MASKLKRPERLELIRRMLIAGSPEWEIRRMLIAGINLDDGRIARVSRGQAHKDLQEIGLAYQSLHDNPLVAERVVGACAERLTRIADKAEAAGNYHAAIRANVELVNIVARKSTRWARTQAPDVAVSAGEGDNDYDNMGDDELRAELARKRARAEQLGLEVMQGGKK